MTPAWQSADGRLMIYKADAVAFLEAQASGSVDVVVADPPYFLSSGGQTCRGGQRASVDKGAWDKARTSAEVSAFNSAWLAAGHRGLSSTGTLWAFGTHHNVFDLGHAMQAQGMRVLNCVTWEKPNPPPNLACRSFTHSTEHILWASKGQKARHFFNYSAMKAVTGKQMKDVWRLAGPQTWELVHGRYPAQKPVALLERMLKASSPPGGRVVDPFMGSGTSGVAAARLGLSWAGCDTDDAAIDLAIKRLSSIEGAVLPDAAEPPANEVDLDAAREAMTDLVSQLTTDQWAALVAGAEVYRDAA